MRESMLLCREVSRNPCSRYNCHTYSKRNVSCPSTNHHVAFAHVSIPNPSPDLHNKG